MAVLRAVESSVSSLQCRRIFGKRRLNTSSRNVWSLSWILKAEEGWGEIEISIKGVVDRREEGGGRGRGKAFLYPPPPCPLLPKSNMTARQTIASL